MPRFGWRDLEALGAEVFARLGAPSEEAAWVARLLVRSNLQGHDSHGVLRIPQYVRAIRAGQIRPGEPPGVEETGPATLRVDGHLGFGQVVARRAMDLAVERARRHGVAAGGPPPAEPPRPPGSCRWPVTKGTPWRSSSRSWPACCPAPVSRERTRGPTTKASSSGR